MDNEILIARDNDIMFIVNQHLRKMDKAAKILVVEDDNLLRKIVVNRLLELKYTAVEAADGERAIELISNKPDLILLDLLLPKIDGFAVLKTVRQHKDKAIASTPVVVMSNLWSNKDILQAQALKIEEYYVKANTDLSEVIKKVEQVLAARKT